MASLLSRLVACLVAVVAVLQLVHLVLLNKLESRRLNELHHLQNHAGGVGVSAPVGEDHPRLGSIINGPQRLVQLGPNDISENEQLAARLFSENEGTIVDSTGEFRIIFDIAGPRPNGGGGGGDGLGLGPIQRASNKQSQSGSGPGPGPGPELNDDFSIDEEASDSTDVTLVTQSDLTNAKYFLGSLVERWEGPISLALFVRNSSQVESSLQFIAQARLCHELIRQYVSFHVVFPFVQVHWGHSNSNSNSNPNKTRLVGGGGGGGGGRRRRRKLPYPSSLSSSTNTRRGGELTECQEFNEDLAGSKSLFESSFNYDDRVYPVNLLRNVARKRVMTEFSFVTDIDMLPSTGLRSKFQKFVRDKQLDKTGDGKKSVFVVPAFESKNGEAPGTKRELLSLIDKYQVRPFYFDLCWKCQVHTDYETWEREPESKTGDLSVLFEVLWKDPWEPFFISDNSVPILDERFRQYGFNRISQLCELHVAGFKFSVLNDAFLVHQGYKTPQSFHPGRSRDIEMNRLNFRQFKIELKDKYPHATRRCY